MFKETYFVEVLLPLPLQGTFTYRVPDSFVSELRFGVRVLVQFGRKKVYSGIIVEVHTKVPTQYEAKYILSVIDTYPVINEKVFSYWKWIAKYYMATLGEVMQAALPGGLILSSESKVTTHPEFNGEYAHLDDKEFLIAEALQLQSVISLNEIEAIIDQKSTFAIIKKLIEKKVVTLEEEVKYKYIPKMVTAYQLETNYNNEQKLKELFDQLVSAPKQLEAITAYVQLSNWFQNKKQIIKRADFIKKASSSAIDQLVKKGVFEKVQIPEDRLDFSIEENFKEVTLTEIQEKAYQEIKRTFAVNQPCLLWGITSSGKTEMYSKLIKQTIVNGGQVLYLIPEIALTTQLLSRLKKLLGECIGVYHSKFNQNERVEVWQELLKESNSRFKLLVGARSTVFLPFYNLKLIIVDEEHDASFKQNDPSPRYNARDLAIVLAQQHKANVLLGSATPSVESYYNAMQNKYGLVSLSARYKNTPLPEIFVSDLKEARHKREMHGLLTGFMYNNIMETLKSKKQVILFKNRRGFSPRVECEDCGFVPECKRCDIKLTYHKFHHDLNCHYCGYRVNLPDSCPQCQSKKIKTIGSGTEKIEEEIQILFPDAKIARMDLDTTRSKSAFKQIISDFENGHIDILIGTQMVTKGLHFKNVQMVGVIDADSMLAFPDFRAHEKAYQLLTQVSGRSGRDTSRGKVVIQTSNPYHLVIQMVVAHNFNEMVKQTLIERKQFNYPPFVRLIKITLRDKNSSRLDTVAHQFGQEVRNTLLAEVEVLGPEYPPIKRLKLFYLKHILIKIPKNLNLSHQKVCLENLIKQFFLQPNNKVVKYTIDVDPL